MFLKRENTFSPHLSHVEPSFTRDGERRPGTAGGSALSWGGRHATPEVGGGNMEEFPAGPGG